MPSTQRRCGRSRAPGDRAWCRVDVPLPWVVLQWRQPVMCTSFQASGHTLFLEDAKNEEKKCIVDVELLINSEKNTIYSLSVVILHCATYKTATYDIIC